MVYLQWKQRLYAFLLRRVLGPYLTRSSLQKLHESIDVSFQEGAFTLKEIELNVAFLTSLLLEKLPGSGIRIQSARIGKLRIILSLQENAKQEEPTSSVVWRAMHLGGETGVSLMAHIEMDGFELMVQPLCDGTATLPLCTPVIIENSAPQKSMATGMISSYVEAALSSLHLSVKINDLRVRFGGMETNLSQKWVQIGLASVHYHEVELGNSARPLTSTSRIALHKAVDFSGTTILTGEQIFDGDEITEQTSVIAKTDGSGHVTLRAVEFDDKSRVNQGGFVRVQNNIEANLNLRLNISVEESSIHRIFVVASDLQTTQVTPTSQTIVSTEIENPERQRSEKGDGSGFDDAEDLKTVEGIMKQYEEAKQLAARNEIRGGMLLPNAENGTLTFDAFFDANDQSIATFASVLEESMMMTAKNDSVHTEIKFYLRELLVKFSFHDTVSTELSAHRRPPEYILCTLGDFNLSSSYSASTSAISASLTHALVESSQNVGNRAEILTIFKFTEENDHDVSITHESSIVSTAPCVDFSFEKHSSVTSCLYTMEMRLHSADVVLCTTTAYKVSALASRLQEKVLSTRHPHIIENAKTTEESVKSDVRSETKVTIMSPCISVFIPISMSAAEEYGEQEKHVADIFRRCGYDLLQEPIVSSTYVGLTLEDLTLSNLNHVLATDLVEGQLISCQRAVLFMTAPRKDSIGRIHSMQRVDLLVASGHAPISMCHKKNGPGSFPSVVRAAFPTVKPISSFKARQDDDDGPHATPTIVGTRSVDISQLRSPDPQPVILKEADKCNSLLEFRFPELYLDLTKSEIIALFHITMSAFPSDHPKKNDVQKSDEPQAFIAEKGMGRSFGFSLTVEQITLNLHHSMDPLGGLDDAHWETFSFSVIGEEWNLFSILGGSTSCTRISTKRADIYEAEGLLPARPEIIEPVSYPQVALCCERILQRTKRNSFTKARPICYRTSLFSVLSPESPVFLVDLIMAQDHETSVYASLYTLSYRHDCESKWVDRLSKLVKFRDETCDKPAGAPAQQNEAESLMRVFVTLADCNVDYAPPMKFVHSSRTIIRVSEVRLSSNIVSPAGSLQTFRLKVGDINLLLCNQRYPYNSENISLPRSSNLLPPEELMVKASRGVNIEHDMNLITMLTLDSVNGIITRTSQAEDENDPGITADFAFGTLCIYGCKDSFGCLINTISEWNLYVTALSSEAIKAMKAKAARAARNEAGEQFFDSLSDEQADAREVKVSAVSNERAVMSQVEHAVCSDHHSFNLDGYDWTTVDHGWSRQGAKSVELQPGEDQVAKWYASDEPAKANHTKAGVGPALLIIPHHVRIHETSDPLIQGDMDAATHAGTQSAPPVTSRVLVRDLKLRCRFFDGYDWPRYVKRQSHMTARHCKFIIDDTMDRKKGVAKNSDEKEKMPKLVKDEKKSRLIGALLDSVSDDYDVSKTFENTPLPEERAALIRDFAEERRLARRMNRFLQISLAGVRARVDTFSESTEHRLASCLDLKVTDFFVSETISDLKPVKLVGEWFNEVEHPRDSNDGLVMMKMVTWRSIDRVTPENEIANDESHAVLHVLPLRCNIDQRAIRFAQSFFTSSGETPPLKWAANLTELPPPKFTWFKVKACKMKVDYYPEKVDVEALRDGSIVELINLSPLTDMVIGLQAVELEDKVGFGAVIAELASSWVKDIVATQMYKFVTYSSVFQPFSSVGGGVADMVILPWDAIRNGEEVSKAFRSGVSSFGETLAFETLNTTAKLTNFAAQQLSKTLASSLPSRPQDTPRGVGETATYAMESLARGFDHANYKIVVVPYKEFQDKGAASAAKSIVRGIPVAILAPLAGVNEAMSYTLLGARNTLRPNIRKEEEAGQRGLHSDY